MILSIHKKLSMLKKFECAQTKFWESRWTRQKFHIESKFDEKNSSNHSTYVLLAEIRNGLLNYQKGFGSTFLCKLKTEFRPKSLTYWWYKMVKFIYSEKVTKFCEIFTLFLTTVQTAKIKVKILQNFVAFSEYMKWKTYLLLLATLRYSIKFCFLHLQIMSNTYEE